MSGRLRLSQVDRPPLADWAATAACRGLPPAIWYPSIDAGRPTRQQDPYEAARGVCAVCPVRVACLAHAIAAAEPHGMWGGLDPAERRQLTDRLAIAQPDLFSAPRAPHVRTIHVKGDVL